MKDFKHNAVTRVCYDFENYERNCINLLMDLFGDTVAILNGGNLVYI